jgi:hypothetical protein
MPNLFSKVYGDDCRKRTSHFYVDYPVTKPFPAFKNYLEETFKHFSYKEKLIALDKLRQYEKDLVGVGKYEVQEARDHEFKKCDNMLQNFSDFFGKFYTRQSDVTYFVYGVLKDRKELVRLLLHVCEIDASTPREDAPQFTSPPAITPLYDSTGTHIVSHKTKDENIIHHEIQVAQHQKVHIVELCSMSETSNDFLGTVCHEIKQKKNNEWVSSENDLLNLVLKSPRVHLVVCERQLSSTYVNERDNYLIDIEHAVKTFEFLEPLYLTEKGGRGKKPYKKSKKYNPKKNKKTRYRR